MMGRMVMALALAGMATPQPVIWGGDHVQIELTDRGGRTEFDCAHGTIDEPLRPGAAGAFSVKGTLTPERSGPVDGEGSNTVKAVYAGTVKEDTMTLRVTVVDHETPLGTFELTRGRSSVLKKCR